MVKQNGIKPAIGESHYYFGSFPEGKVRMGFQLNGLLEQFQNSISN